MLQSHAGTGSSSQNGSPSTPNDGYKVLRGEAGGEKSKHREGWHVDMHFNTEWRDYVETECSLPVEKGTEKVNISRPRRRTPSRWFSEEKAHLEASLKQLSITGNKTILICPRHQNKHCRFTTATLWILKVLLHFKDLEKCSRPGIIIVYFKLKGSSNRASANPCVKTHFAMCPHLKPALPAAPLFLYTIILQAHLTLVWIVKWQM